MNRTNVKDPTNPQFYVVLGLTLLVGFLLGAIVVVVWGPYALEQRRIERAAVQRAEQEVRSEAAVQRAAQINDELIQKRGPLEPPREEIKRNRFGK